MSLLRHEPSEKTRELVTSLPVKGVQPKQNRGVYRHSRKYSAVALSPDIGVGERKSVRPIREYLISYHLAGFRPGRWQRGDIRWTRGRWREMSPTERQIEPEYPKGLSGILKLPALAAPTPMQRAPWQTPRVLTTKGKHDDNAISRLPPVAFATPTSSRACCQGHGGPMPPICLSIDGKIPAGRNRAGAAKLPTLLIGPNVGFSHLNAAAEANEFVFAPHSSFATVEICNAFSRSRICVLIISPPLRWQCPHPLQEAD